MSDIVERLLTEAERAQRKGHPVLAEVCRDASDRIGLLGYEVERLRAALALGIHMREAQTTYFKARSRDALIAAKALEKEFLDRARALLTEAGDD